MKWISLTQPYATLVAVRAKKIETRSWYTPYRGPLGIHASKGFPRWARALCSEEPYKSALAQAGIYSYRDLPLGVLLAKGDLTDCLEINPYGFIKPPEPELSFGDYSTGRFAWLLADMEPLPEPVLWKGQLRLFEVRQYEKS